jgi:hypothetical protein
VELCNQISTTPRTSSPFNKSSLLPIFLSRQSQLKLYSRQDYCADGFTTMCDSSPIQVFGLSGDDISFANSFKLIAHFLGKRR